MDVIIVPPVKDIIFFNISTDYDNQKLSEFLVQHIPLGWRELLDLYKLELQDVGTVLSKLIRTNKHVIAPSPWNIFRSLSLTPWVMTKVVIIGQDPYYQIENGIPSATGCCFECREGDPIRRSLANIFTVLGRTVKGFTIPESGDLTRWAEQGVLLLNGAMTTRVGEVGAHKDIWKFFPIRVLQFLAKMKTNVVYMLWGRDAQNFLPYIYKNSNLVLEASHPVAHGNHNTFFKCNHFNEANEYLIAKGQSSINWVL